MCIYIRTFNFLSFLLQLQSSDNESPAEEEEEVIRLQRENAKSMSMADFGIEDSSEDESDRELTLEVSVEDQTGI